MSIKEKAAVGFTVCGLFLGAAWYVQPHTTADIPGQQADQQQSDLSDAQQNVDEQRRREAMEASEADRRAQLHPSERRPRVTLPRIWRW